MRLFIILLFFLISSISFSQNICRDTNCEIFKGAIELKSLPKKYTGTYIERYEVRDVKSIVWGGGSQKEKNNNIKAIDIINPSKIAIETNNFKNGQTIEIRILNEGETSLFYTFNDNGNVDGIYYSNYKPNNSIITITFESLPRVSFFKNGNISILNTFNTLDERISTTWFYPDQTRRLKADVRGRKFEGTIKSYYPNGKVHKIGSIHDDLMDGYLLTYDEKGSLLKEEFYRENIKDTISNLTKFSTQLFILKLTAEEENKIIDRQEDLLRKNVELIRSEALKIQKEEELKVQETEIAKQKLELEILSKNKSISDLILREKQNEIAKAELFANQKRQEIENLSKENLIKELNIRNQEVELKKNSTEAILSASKISILNRENKLKKLESHKKQQELSKQKLIRNILIGGFSLLILFVFLVLRSLRQNKKANKTILAQKLEVEIKKNEVENAHFHLAEKNREILDSITYAKRIQSAILPQEKTIKSYFPDSLIFYKPKDIVAGDFYWFEVIDDLIIFAAADCTGHGVPGAMVSVVCNNALNRSVKEFNLKMPNQILDKTREIVISEFAKSDEDVKDGMDISLCVFNLKERKLFWSGAHNPLWILRNQEIIEFKADKQPIGKFEHSIPFSLQEIEIKENDEIYFFTDGFQDQFGGEKGKKFKASKMRELLIQNLSESMNEKHSIFRRTFDTWKGSLEQVDDVCIIGVKI